MMNEKTQVFAEKIARLLGESEKRGDDDFLRMSLESINQRLDTIESQLTARNPQPATRNSKPLHYSQERFKTLEDLADEIIAGMQDQKACPYEPTEKPCDNCAMCSSRGF